MGHGRCSGWPGGQKRLRAGWATGFAVNRYLTGGAPVTERDQQDHSPGKEPRLL